MSLEIVKQLIALNLISSGQEYSTFFLGKLIYEFRKLFTSQTLFKFVRDCFSSKYKIENGIKVEFG